MHSRNDYRYYLEHQLMMSGDFLAHYGVKGMKWHKKKAYDESTDTNTYMTLGVGGSNTKLVKYGRDQKKADMRADRRQLHKLINKSNKYRYNENKSIRQNVDSNIQVAKRRRKLKKSANKTVDRVYNSGPSRKDKWIREG